MKLIVFFLMIISGCTYDRMVADVGTLIDRLEVGHGYHVTSSQRWRLNASRPLAITTANPADRKNRERLLTAARGLGRTFARVSLFDNSLVIPEHADIVLVIGWPDQQPIEPELNTSWQIRFLPLANMLPELAQKQPIKLWLFDANNQVLIDKLELEVDPAFWTPAKYDLDLLEHAFASLGAHLTAS